MNWKQASFIMFLDVFFFWCYSVICVSILVGKEEAGMFCVEYPLVILLSLIVVIGLPICSYFYYKELGEEE